LTFPRGYVRVSFAFKNREKPVREGSDAGGLKMAEKMAAYLEK